MERSNYISPRCCFGAGAGFSLLSLPSQCPRSCVLPWEGLCSPQCPLCLQQQTEWQRYLRQSLEVVAKVMELLPTHAFSTLVSPSPALMPHGMGTICCRIFLIEAPVPKKSKEIWGWMENLARGDLEIEEKKLFLWLHCVSWCVLKRVLQCLCPAWWTL